MRLRDALFVEVRDATRQDVVAEGCLERKPGAVTTALENLERHYLRVQRPRSGVAIIIRRPVP